MSLAHYTCRICRDPEPTLPAELRYHAKEHDDYAMVRSLPKILPMFDFQPGCLAGNFGPDHCDGCGISLPYQPEDDGVFNADLQEAGEPAICPNCFRDIDTDGSLVPEEVS